MQRKEMHPLTGTAIEMQKETPAIAAIWYSYLSFSPRATSVHILYAKCAKASYNNINGGKKKGKTTMAGNNNADYKSQATCIHSFGLLI